VACFSFYANKTITTGEGGMATTADEALANRMRTLSLHGMSQDGWGRFRRAGTWDYVIAAPGFKYNMTDVAAALGIEQLRRVVSLRDRRAHIAARYTAALRDVEAIETPHERDDSYHAWHLYPIRLRLDHLQVRREEFIRELDSRGVATSVHWRPLHMQPYYRDRYGYRPEDFPVAFREWQRLISLPLFPGMTEMEVAHVITAVQQAAAAATRKALVA
jgi:dTDP-4-amino-4,6-dideoxygalactose transaminase